MRVNERVRELRKRGVLSGRRVDCESGMNGRGLIEGMDMVGDDGCCDQDMRLVGRVPHTRGRNCVRNNQRI